MEEALKSATWGVIGKAAIFYRDFYCAARYGGVQVVTSSVGSSAKHQLKGTIWYSLVRAEIVIEDS